MSSTQCKIDEIITIKDKYSCPIIADFQNGTINLEKNKVDWHVAKEKENDSKILIARTPSNLYYGTVGKGYPTDLVDTFMAIRNKTTNKIRLIQIEETSMINNVYDNKSTDIEISNVKRVLFKNFGGKKSVQALDKIDKTTLNIDVVQKQLEMTLQDVKIEEEPIKSEENIERSVVPPRNKNASQLKDAYKFEDIIPNKVLNKLNKFADLVLKADIDDLTIEYDIIKDFIIKLLKSENPGSEDNINKIKSCLYIDGLMNLLSKYKVDTVIYKEILISDIRPVDLDIKKRFFLSVDKGRITQYTRQKAIIYLIILLLLLSEKFELNINQLIGVISISKKDLSKFAGLIGASIENSSLVLKLNVKKEFKTFRKNKRMKK